MKKIIAVVLTLSLGASLLVGCGCSNQTSEVEKDQKRADIQKIIKKNKLPFDIKRDEESFELTELQNIILLKNKAKDSNKDSVFLFNYIKWNQTQEEDKDNNVRKLVDDSQKTVSKFPKLTKGKIKKIKGKATYVQYGKIKKGKYKGWYGSKISFQDETDKNKKQLLLVYCVTQNKTVRKQIKNFTKDFLTYDAKVKKDNNSTSEANMFEDLGK